MADRIETLAGARIQHGAHNDRIYLMQIGDRPEAELLAALQELQQEKGYGRIFGKLPAARALPFLRAGYRLEAYLPGYYRGTRDVVFIGRYPDAGRGCPTGDEVSLDFDADQGSAPGSLPQEFRMRELGVEDMMQCAQLFSQVFPSYPFPVHDPQFLKDSITAGTRYFGIFEGDRLAAVSSAETDSAARAAEMTDFATDPVYRGRKLSRILLQTMEDALRAAGFRLVYTIARAVSLPMNRTFFSGGYRYSGTLFRNTQIGGCLESMNVWYKDLAWPLI